MRAKTYRIITALPVALALLFPGAISAAEVATLSAPGHADVQLSAESLGQLPAVTATTAYRSSHGIQSGIYKGVLLWDILIHQGLVTENHKAALRNVVIVTATDGHQVAFSVGEIAPDFGNREILLAYEMNDAPIPDGLRMVVPGDLRGTRHIKDIKTLEFR
jgi:hypothetical protein